MGRRIALSVEEAGCAGYSADTNRHFSAKCLGFSVVPPSFLVLVWNPQVS